MTRPHSDFHTRRSEPYLAPAVAEALAELLADVPDGPIADAYRDRLAQIADTGARLCRYHPDGTEIEAGSRPRP